MTPVVRRAVGLSLVTVLCLTVSACSVTFARPGDAAQGVRITEDLEFGGPADLRLDVCEPAGGETLRPAIIAIHGGGWTRGDKQDRPWREACEWLAAEGYVVFQTNYRLAPEHPYPAALEDLTMAVDWIRDAHQAERFGHDPDRLGAFGDSAGGNLAALLGTRGTGDTGLGSRVGAVVELSAPIDLTLDGVRRGGLSLDFQQVQLDYLGCVSYDDCAVAAEASPSHYIDESDPPFFVVHSSEEFIPVEQADDFVARLRAVGVDVTYVRVEGSEHGLSVLDDALRGRIIAWLGSQL